MGHDETLLLVLWKKLCAEGLDLVIASRNIEGGGMGDFAGSRVRLSRVEAMLASLVAPKTLTMSGFFIVSRSFFSGGGAGPVLPEKDGEQSVPAKKRRNPIQ